MSNQEKVLDIHDVPKWNQWLILSLQHIFAMFGATILVPFLTEMPPNVALITSGLGTLAYIFITKGRIPAYLGSSFALLRRLSLQVWQMAWLERWLVHSLQGLYTD